MTAQEELKRLAVECQICASKDDRSIDEHMEDCPACLEHKVKAEELSRKANSVEMLAIANEVDRLEAMKKRSEELLGMSEPDRIAAIADMTDAMAELSEEDRVLVMKGQTDNFSAMPRAKREVLFGSLQKVIAGWPVERKQMERRALHAATRDYNILKRLAVRNMIDRMLD